MRRMTSRLSYVPWPYPYTHSHPDLEHIGNRSATCKRVGADQKAGCSLFPQPNARTTAVGVDELDARRLQSAPEGVKRQASGIMSTGFELADGHDTNEGGLSQIGLAPA